MFGTRVARMKLLPVVRGRLRVVRDRGNGRGVERAFGCGTSGLHSAAASCIAAGCSGTFDSDRILGSRRFRRRIGHQPTARQGFHVSP